MLPDLATRVCHLKSGARVVRHGPLPARKKQPEDPIRHGKPAEKNTRLSRRPLITSRLQAPSMVGRLCFPSLAMSSNPEYEERSSETNSFSKLARPSLMPTALTQESYSSRRTMSALGSLGRWLSGPSRSWPAPKDALSSLATLNPKPLKRARAFKRNRLPNELLETQTRKKAKP